MKFQPDCDPTEPEEHFLWAVQSIPLLGRGCGTFLEPIARSISKHLWECGFRHDPALQTKKWQRPYRGEQHVLNGSAQWMPMDAEEEEPVVIQDPALMTVREREAQVERLRYLGYKVNDPVPEPPKARVVDALDQPPRWDPAPHSVTEVNAFLRGLEDDPVERGRILFAERNGKARNGILRRWPNG